MPVTRPVEHWPVLNQTSFSAALIFCFGKLLYRGLVWISRAVVPH
jgi:hypothetical protein